MLKKLICCVVFLHLITLQITLTPIRAQSTSEVIVELEKNLNSQQIIEQFPSLQIKRTYKTVFNGFSARIPTNEIELLQGLSGVKKVHPNVTYNVSINESVEFIGGNEIRDSIFSKYQDITGKGIKVGVIDTGIDYTHPDLKMNYVGGYDVVDEDDNPMETQESQGEPTLHGTHVAGIIAANGKLKGVAPEVELYGYRALGPGGVGTTEQVIAAIEKAVEDGMDIINLSLGNSVNGPDWPTSIAIEKAVEKGVVAVTSNGNSGPNLWTVGSPGTAPNAISVGASTPPLTIPFLTIGNERKKIYIKPMGGSVPWTNVSQSNMNHDHKLIFGNLGKKGDLKKVKGKIVLISRGEIPFSEKASNAEEAGAAGVLIYNNEEGVFSGLIEEEVSIPVAAISKQDGEFLLSQLKQGSQWIETGFQKSVDQIAEFSSRGPVTHSWGIKPDISAPGVQIKSTVPSGYMALQGTSMAAPHITGVAALIKQAHPDWNPNQIKAAIMNTAKELYQKRNDSYSHLIQGTGRVQLPNALSPNSLIYPASLSFGLIEENEQRMITIKKLTIENHTKRSIKYVFKQPKYTHGVQWELPLPFEIKPNQKKEIEIKVTLIPRVLKKGFHEGELTIEGNRESIRIPYLFVIGEPDYPRVMGFDFRIEDEDINVSGFQSETYKYEFYLPEDAEELGVIFYNYDTLRQEYILSKKENVKRGRHEGVINRNEIPIKDGIYKVLIYAKRNGNEDYMIIDTIIGKYGNHIKENKNTSVKRKF